MNIIDRALATAADLNQLREHYMDPETFTATAASEDLTDEGARIVITDIDGDTVETVDYEPHEDQHTAETRIKDALADAGWTVYGERRSNGPRILDDAWIGTVARAT